VVDVASLAAPLSDEQRAALEDDLGAPVVGRYLLEVWIDDDELVHRFELAIDEVATGEAIGGDQPDGLTMVFEFWDHGVDPGITPPPADEVVTEAELGFSLEDLSSLAG
ncbi:MAG: hypothetical protein AAGA93_28505, partial [Actinomycetota bacterium]